MKDFGAVFDKAKVDLDAKIQGLRDSDERGRQVQSQILADRLKPINVVVRPIIEQARDALAVRGVDLKIDHDSFYNEVAGQKIPAMHFQITYGETRSKTYIFAIEDRSFYCSADDGTKKPKGQRIGVFATSSDNVSPDIVEGVVEQAINDIMQSIEHTEFRKIFPNAR